MTLSTDDFKMLSERDHIRIRPAMYIGSVSVEPLTGIYNFQYKTLMVVPGLLKIINEVLDNTVDEAIRTSFKFANKVSVSIKKDPQYGWQIEISDNGRGIPVQQIEGKYRAELAWTKARAGSNFSNDESRITLGMNGVGAYATNCFSDKFVGESCDGKTKITVSCTNGCETVTTTSSKCSIQGTTVTFYPDLELFGLEDINDDVISIIEDRIFNLSLCYPDIEFKFNGKKIKSNISGIAKSFNENAISLTDDSYTMVIAPSGDDEEFRHLSYMNGLNIKNGGNHIDFIIQGICEELMPMIKRKWKIAVLPNQIKQHLLIATWARNFQNLKFDSQSKERVTNTFTEIKSYFNIDFSKLAKKIISEDSIIMPMIESILRKKEAQDKRAATLALKKTQKKKIVNHIAASSKIYEEKTLYISEGQSASGMGLNVRDPKFHGFYSLRGKVMNTHGMSEIDIVKNKELSELITILGLDLSTESIYDEHDAPVLNYGRIAGLQDQDMDGHSIFCLMLMFFSRWPALFNEGRIVRVNTPLFIAKKKGKDTKYYYSFEEYEVERNKLAGYDVSYLKGLGSLDEDDYKETVILNPRFVAVSLDDIDKLNMAFGDSADLRKEWMIG